MQVADIQHLYDYNWWANERVLTMAECLSPEQFATASFGSINLRTTLVHMVEAQAIWLSRWLGSATIPPAIAIDTATIESIRTAWREQKEQITAYLATLNDDDLERDVHYVNRMGIPGSFRLDQLMLQVLNHGTQHRSEIAALLTELGHSPGDLDYVVFINEQRQTAANK